MNQRRLRAQMLFLVGLLLIAGGCGREHSPSPGGSGNSEPIADTVSRNQTEERIAQKESADIPVDQPVVNPAPKAKVPSNEGESKSPEQVAISPPAHPDPGAEALEQLVEHMASDLILESHFENFRGSAIEIFAGRTDWPLNWRLACTFMAANQYAYTLQESSFKELLESKLGAEARDNAINCDAHLMEMKVQARGRMADAFERLKGARENLVEAEIRINDKITPEGEDRLFKLGDIVQVISMLESATSEEVLASRNQLKDRIRQALKDDAASLKALLESKANAESAATDELRQSRERLTKAIKEALKS